jgi:hypothetical protein
MTDNEIREFVHRLEQTVEFRKAKSHIERLESGEHLRIRSNRDACLSFAMAFLQEALDAENRTPLNHSQCRIVEGHEQLYGDFGLVLNDIRLFDDWEKLPEDVQRARKVDYVSDRLSLLGCALIAAVVLVPVAAMTIWYFDTVSY